MEEVLKFITNGPILAVLTWIGGIAGIYYLVGVWREISQKRSVKAINKRINFLKSHDSYVSRIEYGISSILIILAIISTIFMFEFDHLAGEQEVNFRFFEFAISSIAYCVALYKSGNFKNLVNRKQELDRLNKQKSVVG